VRTVIVALGLNDRDCDTSDTISNIRFLHDWSQRSGKNIFFLGVPPFDTLNRTEQLNIEFLNNVARDIFGPQYISPLPAEEGGWVSSCLMAHQHKIGYLVHL